MRIAVLFDNFGPYHMARLRSVADRCETLGVEFHARSQEYAWEAAERKGLNIVTLSHGPAGEQGREPSLAEALATELSTFRPDVVAVPGWSSPGALQAVQWCGRTGTPAVLMAESSERDEPRVWWKEWIKRQLVRGFPAALVGGERHVHYLKKLGMRAEQIFTGYDVVDNDHFLRPRTEDDQGRRHFLASARFVEKKNLPCLLRAYALYRERPAGDPWDLILLGDGPLRPALESLIHELHLTPHVTLPGFRQYDELPEYYARASAFVHASTTEQWGLVVNEATAAGLPVIISEACGCVPELVEEGVNGYTFDPGHPELLAQKLLLISSQPEDQRKAMGQASQRAAARLGVDQFALGMEKAAKMACEQSESRLPLTSKVLLKLLSHQ